MLKLLGLLLLFSSATLLGCGAASALADRVDVLAGLVGFWKQFALQLDTLRCAPRRLVTLLNLRQEYTDQEFVQALVAGFDQNESFGQALQAAWKHCPTLDELELWPVLLPLGESIGVEPLENQLTAIAWAVHQLEERLEQARADYQKKGSLYRRLGMLGGGLLAVLFI